jgi:hypothetical protein
MKPPILAQTCGAEVLIDSERLWDYAEVDSNAKPGLGRFAYRDGDFNGRNRPWVPIFWNDINPPPLPRLPGERRRCGCCDHEHICGACGQPYWIEYHGVADGACTYCYYHG